MVEKEKWEVEARTDERTDGRTELNGDAGYIVFKSDRIKRGATERKKIANF
jgi:hypothetical protein